VRQHAGAGPRVARIVAGCQPPLGEVDGDPRRAGAECLADVLLALVDEVGFSSASIDGAITACFIGLVA